MRVEKHPYNYPIEETFLEKRFLTGFEGCSIWIAEKNGLFYLISEEGTMADFLIPGEDDDLLNETVVVYIFKDESEREQYINQRGWNNLRRVEG